MRSSGFNRGAVALKGTTDLTQEKNWVLGVYNDSFSLRRVQVLDKPNEDYIDLLTSNQYNTIDINVSTTFNSSIVMKSLDYPTQQEVSNSISNNHSILYVDKDTQKLIFKSNIGKWDLTSGNNAVSASNPGIEEPVETLDLNAWAISNDQTTLYTFHNIAINTDETNASITLDGAISMKEQSGFQPIYPTTSFGKLYVGNGDLHYLSGSGVDVNISEKLDSNDQVENGEGMQLNPWNLQDNQETISTQCNVSISTEEQVGNVTVGGSIAIQPLETKPSDHSTFGQIYSRKDGHLYYTNELGKTLMITNEADEQKECTIEYTPSAFSISDDLETVSIFNHSDHFIKADGTMRMKEYLTVSDLSLKDNIRDISFEECSNVISQLKAKKYQWKDTGEEAIGMIAQEVENVVPLAVNQTNDLKGINYTSIVPYLIGSIQQLQQKIKILENNNN
jgi:hypothetical protein